MLSSARTVAELLPGGISTEVVVTQARSLLEEIVPVDPAAVERHRQAVELVDEIDRLDVVKGDSRRRISVAVAASATTLTEIFGVGPIVAAMLIGFTGDATGFTTASRYAAYTGTAPIEFSSGGRTTRRLAGKGTADSTTRCTAAAMTQIRHRHSPGRGYYDRKLAEGHTRREAIRASNDASATSCGVASCRRAARHRPLTSGLGQDTSGTSLSPA